MILKVCGMKDAENTRRAEALGIDMIGNIFYPGSPRYEGASLHTEAGKARQCLCKSVGRTSLPYCKCCRFGLCSAARNGTTGVLLIPQRQRYPDYQGIPYRHSRGYAKDRVLCRALRLLPVRHKNIRLRRFRQAIRLVHT